MNPKLQNWHNFCQDHAGNWHGTWTTYSSAGKVIKFLKCIRSFQVKENCHGWQGKLQKITPDYIVSSPVPTSWKQLEDLEADYLTWKFNDGISVSCPQQIEPGKKFF